MTSVVAGQSIRKHAYKPILKGLYAFSMFKMSSEDFPVFAKVSGFLLDILMSLGYKLGYKKDYILVLL